MMNHRKLVTSIQKIVHEIVLEKEYTLDTMITKIKEERLDTVLSIVQNFFILIVMNLFIVLNIFYVNEYTLALKLIVSSFSLSGILYFLFTTKKDIARLKVVNSLIDFNTEETTSNETKTINTLLEKQEGANLQPVDMKKQVLVYNTYVKSVKENKLIEQYILAKEYIKRTNMLVTENKKISTDDFTVEFVKRLNLDFRHTLAFHNDVTSTEEKKLILLN